MPYNTIKTRGLIGKTGKFFARRSRTLLLKFRTRAKREDSLAAHLRKEAQARNFETRMYVTLQKVREQEQEQRGVRVGEGEHAVYITRSQG